MFLQYDKIVNCLIQKVLTFDLCWPTYIFVMYITSQAASTTWFAEFWQLESNTTLPNGERPKIEKKRLRMKKEIFESMSSDPKFPLLLFSTVRHPLDRLVSSYPLLGFRDISKTLIGRAPTCTLLGSNWTRAPEYWNMFRVLLAPALLCHKEPACRIKNAHKK